MNTVDSRSLSDAALHGTLWTTLQTIFNKVAVIAATLVLARHLTPEDYGDAFNATTIGAFAFVLAPWVLNDFLVSQPRRFDEFAGSTLLIGIVTAVVLGAVLVGFSPLLHSYYATSANLVALLTIASTRPLADALMSVPWARLRIDLAYRSLAITDGTCQLAGTAASVILALAGAGPFAIVAPPIAVLFFQSGWYWLRIGRRVPLSINPHATKLVCRAFFVAGLGQYLNNVVKLLELIVLGWFAKPSQVGIFAFAFQLSTQANVIIANQIAAVIHPILSHINDAPERQTIAFLRALRLVGCVGIPVSFVQGAIASPLFSLLFGDKWAGAVPVFAMLSIMQACLFLSTPIMTLLKSQGRFRAIVAWQFMHITLGGAAMVACVHLTGDSLNQIPRLIGMPTAIDTPLPLAIAMISSACWGIGCPLALLVAARGTHLDSLKLLQVLWQPWPAGLVAACILLLAPHLLPLPDGLCRITTIALAIPLALLAIAAAARAHPQSNEDMRMICGAVLKRFSRSGSA